ncbi:MAG: bifunctional 4-hydroxy-2-oxoglutarate aldolase/2-dehydro-3-deoxy-phosphogluconate aldolase [Victivallaceae bacterium]|nr:bifunctional 4-hydroxy-2-oxoglutarate aldolase/2-dehydro-3-deoxy-phosphogluconate aldolase [Victivallaceae bacterium]
MPLIEKLEQIKIVPVLVLNNLDEGIEMCRSLCENGLGAAEITFRTQAAESVIREVSRQFPEMVVGAGTILNVADLHRAFDAGAKFAVSPGFNPKVVAEAVKCGFEFAPGVCTPSECEQAMEFGCKLLKFFPAEASGGTAMLKSLIAPYRHLGIKFMPTGGVKPNNVESYLEIPEVAAVGGTWLNKCPVETIKEAAAIAAKYIRK